MLRVNFKSYGNYIVDSLYQWDKNQVLEIEGLALEVIPEIHFSNLNMRRSIVKQATIEDGIIKADIPNSLLQQPLFITAYIGIYEGEKFNTIETVIIPVIPRTKPEDYVLENDEEVYSFVKLENELANKVTYQEFNDSNERITTDLNQKIDVERDRITNLSKLEPGSTTGDAELQDIRVGYDGTEYENAGEAVRGQVGSLSEDSITIYKSVTIVGSTDPIYSVENEEENSFSTYLFTQSGWDAGQFPEFPEEVRIGQKQIGIITLGKTKSSRCIQILFDNNSGNVYIGSYGQRDGSFVFYGFKKSSDFSKYLLSADFEEFKTQIEERLSDVIYYVEKDGTGDFTSLTDAIFSTNDMKNIILYVGDGEWDLINEFKEKFGDDYFDTFKGAAGRQGLYIQNGIKIIFSSNSSVVFNYIGENENVHTQFSPFNSGPGGFTVENLTLYASNCRYAIHDERGIATDRYKNHYINCHIEMDNTNNPDWSNSFCIGGGLGNNGEIIIEDCFFKTEDEKRYIVSYHNSPLITAKSRIFIKNCYFDKTGSLRFTYHGTSEKITEIYVTGCSIGSSIFTGSEVPSSDITNNIKVIEWNNEVRSM